MNRKPSLRHAAFLTTLICLASVNATGCARRTTTVQTTEVERDSDARAQYGSDDRDRVEVTKTEKTTSEDNHHGFFGIIGDILALPFRAIAAIL